MEQIVIDGKGTYDDWGMSLLSGGVKTDPPKPKTYAVDLPGSDGSIDLTEYAGDVAYGDRSMSFTLLVPGYRPDAIAGFVTRLDTWLHGRRLTFALSWDPGYTYVGRFSVEEAPNNYAWGSVTLDVTADPYKTRDDSPLTWRVNAAGGVWLDLPVGRRRVCPTIEVNRRALVTHGGKTWELMPGASRVRDLWLTAGGNPLLINTYPGYSIATWADVSADVSDAWSPMAGEAWSELAAGDTPPQAPDLWADHATDVWADSASKRWVELSHGAESGDEFAAYVQYDYQDL